MVNFEYKKSNKHGYGLFATEDIKKGDYICYYYGRIEKKSEYKQTDFNPYAMEFGHNGDRIIGETDITKIQKDGYAQFINDGAFEPFPVDTIMNAINSMHPMLKNKNIFTLDNKNNNSNDYNNIYKLLNICLLYKVKCIEKNNVQARYEKDKITIFATTDIKKGDELLLQYGITYWLYYYINNYKNKIIDKGNNRLMNTEVMLMMNLGIVYNNAKNSLKNHKTLLDNFNKYFNIFMKKISNKSFYIDNY